MFKRLINRFWFWYHRKDVVTLYSSFIDPKYPSTGIAQRPEDLLKFSTLHGWKPKKFNRVLHICIKHDIIQDHPNNPKKAKGNKKFFYILNPSLLK
jgi:hypothetical protein